VPEAEPVTAAFRARFDSRSVARRIPPHVTALFPFVAADDVALVWDRLATLTASLHAFDAALVDVRRFEQHVWLAPDPRDLWLELIDATCRCFPETPPYEGIFETPEPHLTVGEATDDVTTESILEGARHELAPHLPLRFRVEELSLLEEQADGTWSIAARRPLG
jgi:2'-5' RNA ligase